MFAASTLIPNQHCIAAFAGAAVVVLQLGAAITPAHSAGGEAVKISNAWVAAEQVGGNVALSMTIKNEADVADALLRVRCPVANFSEKHTVDRGEGSPAMRAIPSIPIAASSTTVLKPDAYHDKGEVITGAPLIVKNMAITGVAGAEYGIRGWLAATDLPTQKEVWRTFTIPGKGEPGHDTWKDDNNAAASGGGSTWVTGSYDPATDTIIWGIGNPGPDWDNQYRPGDNLYTDSSLALDATTGKIKWHYQHTPNDPYDYDSVAENVLVDVPGPGGAILKLALEADRNGFAYAIDRTTGKFV